MNKREAVSLFAYDSWANALLFEAASKLDAESLRRNMGTSHESLLGAMVHIVGAEEIWLSRWKDAPRSKLRSTDEIPTLDALMGWWKAVREERDRFVETLTDADMERTLEMSTSTGDTFTHTFAEMFRHLANHSSYHRGQMASLLRALGQKPPSTDLIRFYRQS